MKINRNTRISHDPGGEGQSNEPREHEDAPQAAELLETIGLADQPLSATRAPASAGAADNAVLRDVRGRFRKGTPSPNPRGAPRKPDLGLWTNRMQRTRTVAVNGQSRQVSDREYLDRVLQRAALNGDPAAIKLWIERREIEIANDDERAARARYDQRVQRERELGIKGVGAAEALRRERQTGDFIYQLIRNSTGNFTELKERLVDMQAVSLVDGTWELADWIETDTDTLE